MTTLKQAAQMYGLPKIKLTQGKQATVDVCNLKKLSKFKWCAVKKSKTYYAYTSFKNNKTPIAMHRFILNAPKDKIVDHKDGNGLNNQTSNIRLCTHSQNKMNIPNYKNNTSGFRGVVWDKRRNEWLARIKLMGKHINLGRFDSKEEAIKCRRKKAKELFGEFVNDIDKMEDKEL